MTPLSNRRVSARKVLRRPATVTLPGGVERVVRTWDVGLDGLSLVSPKPIPPGTRCTVTVDFPDGDAWRPVQIPVKTVYCSLMGTEGVKVGMVFAALDADTERVIQRFVE
jgi:hypothetical protein